MRYLIKERIFSIEKKFDIRDQSGSIKYIVEGEVFSLGKKLSITDSKGNLLIKIEQKLLRLLDEYRIIENNREVAKVSRQISLFRPKYNIRSIYGDYMVDGDVIKHDFNILKANKLVAFVRKKLLAFSDTYSVEIVDEEDHPFILALVIILDQVHHDGNKNATKSNNMY